MHSMNILIASLWSCAFVPLKALFQAGFHTAGAPFLPSAL
jgi:hypothetical protein